MIYSQLWIFVLISYHHPQRISIPVEDLASNGESVRAKVFHIVTALCTQVPATDLNYDLVRDWCNMVSSFPNILQTYFRPSPFA